jgi:hypothetical protein
MEVEPRGEADVERNGSVALECADAAGAREAVRMRRDVQVEWESTKTRRNTVVEEEEASVTMNIICAVQLTYIPESPPEPPDETTQHPNKPSSVELEGGTSGDASGDEELLNVSEHECKQREEETSPRSGPDNPDNPGGKTAAPGGVHSNPEGSKSGRTAPSTRRTHHVAVEGHEACGCAGGVESRRGCSGLAQKHCRQCRIRICHISEGRGNECAMSRNRARTQEANWACGTY